MRCLDLTILKKGSDFTLEIFPGIAIWTTQIYIKTSTKFGFGYILKVVQ